MKKVKVSANILSLLILISLFIGWEYILILTAFIWCFCDTSQNIKNLTIRAIAVYAACYLFTMAWSLVSDGYGLGVEAVEGLFQILASWGVDVLEATANITKYVLSPLGVVVSLLGNVVSFLVLFAKFKFVYSIVTNKPMTGIFGKIQQYINYFVNFATSNLYEDQQVQQQPQQQVPQMQQQ